MDLMKCFSISALLLYTAVQWKMLIEVKRWECFLTVSRQTLAAAF